MIQVLKALLYWWYNVEEHETYLEVWTKPAYKDIQSVCVADIWFHESKIIFEIHWFEYSRLKERLLESKKYNHMLENLKKTLVFNSVNKI